MDFLVCCNNPTSGSGGQWASRSRSQRASPCWVSCLACCLQILSGGSKVRAMGDEGNVAALIGSPTLSHLVEKVKIFFDIHII